MTAGIDTRIEVRPPVLRRRSSAWSLPEVRWAALATGLFGLGALVHLAGGSSWWSWLLYLACYAAGGWEPGLAGLKALRDKTLDVDLLMVVAAIGAAAIGQVFDGALLIVIFATSGALEVVATQRTEDSVRGLLDIAPETATRLTESGAEEQVETAVLDVGDVLMVRPGERIGGGDGGVVIDGAARSTRRTSPGGNHFLPTRSRATKSSQARSTAPEPSGSGDSARRRYRHRPDGCDGGRGQRQ